MFYRKNKNKIFTLRVVVWDCFPAILIYQTSMESRGNAKQLLFDRSGFERRRATDSDVMSPGNR